MKNYEKHKQELLKKPGFRKAYKESEVEYQAARLLILARAKKKLTQKQLANKLGTKQSVISRVENAKTIPSLSFLQRVAKVVGMRLELRFT